MAVKKSIFGSNGEKRGFESIESMLGEEYRLLPQFPFSALFEPDDTVKTSNDFFYKTSIDYVLCTKRGNPLLAIDFDGLGKGFSTGVQYVEVCKTSDQYRKWKFDYKLQYAMKNFFPYYVVASEEFEELDLDINLTIVDGLIGRELFKRDIRERIQSSLDANSDAIAGLNPTQQEQYIQQLVAVTEIESELENDPIVRKTAEVKCSISALGGWSGASRFDWVDDSKLTNLGHETKNTPGKVKRVGCEYKLRETPVGDVSAIAWMRNLGDYWIVHNIAELLVSTKLLRLVKKTPKSRWVASRPAERVLSDTERAAFLDQTQGQSYN